MQFKLNSNLTKDEINKIMDIFREYDAFTYNHDDPEDVADWNGNYFIVGLDDNECEDTFYDHSEAFSKIFKELNCVCTGFQYNNDYVDKYSVNTHYGMWFERLETE